jgi:hypothetical protein
VRPSLRDDWTLVSLRRNDPDEMDASLYLRGHCFDVMSLSDALASNQHVEQISLFLDRLGDSQDTNWDSLLHVLSTRENLKEVDVYDKPEPTERNPPDGANPFLLALQQNPNIQTVWFFWLRLSGDSMAAFLDAATSVTTLTMERCIIEAPGGALGVAAALQRNTNIQQLKLDYLDETDLIPILTGLASNTTLQELQLGFLETRPSLAVSRALKNLFESTATIQQFELFIESYIEGCTFRPIAQGLIQSKSVSCIVFDQCAFVDKEDVLIFNSILESKSNLQSLALSSCFMHEDGRTQFRDAIVSHLQQHSLLRNLKLVCSLPSCVHLFGDIYSYGFETPQNFARLLTAVETSPLEHFSIGTISEEKCPALIESIPKMQLQSLEFYLPPHPQDLKEDIIQAVKRNASLRTVVGKVMTHNGLDNLFGDDDMMKLTLYCTRNEFFGQWIEYRATVPRAAWPEYLTVAQFTGPNTAFCILQVLAPSMWAHVGEQGRKRRRPDSTAS